MFSLPFTGRDLDAIARTHLWELGLDFEHDTGNGVGHYLSVHEGPVSFRHGYNSQDQAFLPGMFISNGRLIFFLIHTQGPTSVIKTCVLLKGQCGRSHYYFIQWWPVDFKTRATIGNCQ